MTFRAGGLLTFRVAIIAAALLAEAEGECPDKWLMVAGNCYYYEMQFEFLKFDEAEKFCVGLGGHLPSIHDTSEYDAFQGPNVNRTRWLGIVMNSGENVRWTDGSDVDFERWCPGEKEEFSKYEKGCGVRLYNFDCWKIRNCDEKISRRITCKRNGPGRTTTKTTDPLRIPAATAIPIPSKLKRAARIPAATAIPIPPKLDWTAGTPVPPMTTISTSKPTSSNCPERCRYFEDVCYCCETLPKFISFNEAEQYCVNRNGHLSAILSGSKGAVLQNDLEHMSSYIGLYYENGKTFRLSDQSEVEFVEWCGEEPNWEKNLRACVFKYFRECLKVVDCDEKAARSFICETRSTGISSAMVPLTTTIAARNPMTAGESSRIL